MTCNEARETGYVEKRQSFFRVFVISPTAATTASTNTLGQC